MGRGSFQAVQGVRSSPRRSDTREQSHLFFNPPLHYHQSGMSSVRRQGYGQAAIQSIGSCRAQPPTAEEGSPAFHSHGDRPSPAECPPQPQWPASGLSHSLNTVCHCCLPWQAQICPSSARRAIFPLSCPSLQEGRWVMAEGREKGEKRAPLFLSQAGTSGHKLTACVRERTPLPHVPETDG